MPPGHRGLAPPGELTLVVTTATRRGPAVSWRLTIGLGAVLATVAAAVIVHRFPGPNPVDRAGFALVPINPHDTALRGVTEFGAAAALIVGSVGAALLAWWPGRNRLRALACLVSPSLAVALNELVLKPVVGRRYLGALTFPSGSVVVVAAVATAWALAAPPRARPIVIVAGAVLVILMVLAVIALQWHYPSDALAGITFGTGVVLLVDVALVRNDESR